MFIIKISYKTDDLAAIAALRPEHYAHLGPHFDSGLFLLGGRLVPPVGGIMIAEGTDREHLEALFSAEPYFKAGLADYEILELMPTKVGRSLTGIIEPQPI
jgi:uncharacterized protein YciI